MIDLHRLLRYDVWANREALRSLAGNRSTAKSQRWMAHIIGAEFIWLARLNREEAPLPVWPELDPGDCARQLEALSSEWSGLLAQLDGDRLGERISYTNSKGERWTSTVGDILTHVIIHSAYHRGQIAADLRSNGLEPAYTDYIHAARQGLIE